MAGLLLACLLTACGDKPNEPEPVAVDGFGVPLEWDGEPEPSWQAWVERQTELRGDLGSFYRPAYMAEMSNWHAEDFLPQAYLDAPMHDICELPKEEQSVLLNLRMNEPDELARLLDYAERGYLQAMVRISDEVCNHHPARPPVFDRKEALAWSKRAAASGDSYASLSLADCMRSVYLDRDYETAGLPPAELQPNSFWFDQMIYWYWRAAHGLQPQALNQLYYGVYGFYYPDKIPSDIPDHKPEPAIETYKWLRLNQLGQVLYGYTKAPKSPEAILDERWPHMSDEEVAEAERRVVEFLRRFGGGLAQARYDGYGCPGERINHERLNQELERYGLRIEPEQPWTAPSYPLLPRPLKAEQTDSVND